MTALAAAISRFYYPAIKIVMISNTEMTAANVWQLHFITIPSKLATKKIFKAFSSSMSNSQANMSQINEACGPRATSLTCLL